MIISLNILQKRAKLHFWVKMALSPMICFFFNLAEWFGKKGGRENLSLKQNIYAPKQITFSLRISEENMEKAKLLTCPNLS